jgi:hypothetical protein
VVKKKNPFPTDIFFAIYRFWNAVQSKAKFKRLKSKEDNGRGDFCEGPHMCSHTRWILASIVRGFVQTEMKLFSVEVESNIELSWSEISCQYLLLLLSTLIIYSTAASDCSLIVEPTWWTALSVEQ